MRDLAVILYYDYRSRYSINALVAAIDPLRTADIYIVEGMNRFMVFLKKIASKYRRCIIGFSLQTYMLADDDFLEFILSVNKGKGKCLSVAGGPHASGDPLGSILSLGFNYAVIGEGEETFPEIIRYYSEYGDVSSVRGLFYIEDDKPVFTGRRKPIDLNNYPPFPYWRYIFNPIEISRGCPYGCKYCQVSYMHGFSMRHRSIDNIIYYARYMVRSGLRDLRFISPDSLAYGLRGESREPRLDLIEELLHRLYEEFVVKHGSRIFYGTFPSEVRPEHLTREAARILRKYVANRDIIMGAQTGSNRLLRLIGRKHSIEDVYEAVENALIYGFRPDVDYIIGLPGETREDLLETLRSIRKLVGMGARIHLHVFLPLPGTPFAWAPPGRIPEWVKRELMRLIGRGKAYGQWLHQERLAAKIDYLRRRGVIMPRIRDRIKAAPGLNTQYSVPP